MTRTRVAVFSMLEGLGVGWPECRVLDLYAGSGILAFEALSRGAPVATLVDVGAQAASAMARNAEALGVTDRCRIVAMDALRFLRQPQPWPYGLVFVDPPYRQDLGRRTLAALARSGAVMENGLVAAELETGLDPGAYPGLLPRRERRYGQTTVHIWEMQGAAL